MSPTTQPTSAESDRSTPVRIGRLLGLLGAQRWWVVATALLAFATLGSGVGLIAMAAYLISRSAFIDSTATIALAITGVRFFAVSRATFRYLERYVGHLGTFRVLTRLRVWFFRGMEPLAPAGLRSERQGDLLARILGDIDSVQDFSLRVFVPAVAAVLTTALVAVLLGSFSPVLGIAAVLFLALVGFVLPWVSRKVGEAASHEAAATSALLDAEAVESIGGLAELVAWGREERFTDAMRDLSERRCRADTRLATISGVATGLGALLMGLAAMTLLGLVVPILDGGGIEPEYIAVMPLVMIAAFEAVQPLSAAMEHLDRARRAAGRLDALVGAEPAVGVPDPPVEPPAVAPGAGLDLEISDLWFSYASGDGLDPPVLSGASLQVPAGAFVALLGPSGAGKSTLVEILQRFLDYRQGSIRLGGVELSELAHPTARSLVATVAQHDHLFDTSVRDNLLLADPEADDARIQLALDAAACDFVGRIPGGLDARIGEDGSRLSGGERQRLMVARALLAEAPILVLDEATAHLDPDTEAKVLRGVRSWHGARTLIVISHRTTVASEADLVASIDAGRIETIEH